MIDRLEHSGLGYHIEAHQTADKLGRWQPGLWWQGPCNMFANI